MYLYGVSGERRNVLKWVMNMRVRSGSPYIPLKLEGCVNIMLSLFFPHLSRLEDNKHKQNEAF